MAEEPTTTEEDAPPPPPPVVTDVNLWNPGGDGDALRTAADAWSSMATTLRERAGDVRSSRDGLGETWTGGAREAYDIHIDDLLASMEEAADGFDEIATELRGVGDQIDDINRQIHEIYLAIAATAVVSVAASFVTFGFSAAAGAANAARLTAQATGLVRTLATVISGVRVSFTAFRTARFLAVWRSFAIGAAGTTVATGVGKAVFQQQNPFDLDNWTITDLRNIIVGGAGNAVLGGPLTVFERGLRTRIATGAVATTTPTVITDIRDGLTPGEIIRNGGINLLFGGAGGALGHLFRNRNVTQGRGAPAPAQVGDVDIDLGLPRLEVPTPSGTGRGPGGLLTLDPPPGHTTSPGGLLVPDRPNAGVQLQPGESLTPGGLIVRGGPDPQPPIDLGPGETVSSGGVVLPPGVRPPDAPVQLGPGEVELPSGVVLPPGVQPPGVPDLTLPQEIGVGQTGAGGGLVNSGLAEPTSPTTPDLDAPPPGGGSDDAWWHELEPDPGGGGGGGGGRPMAMQ